MAKLRIWTIAITARRDRNEHTPPEFVGERAFNSTWVIAFFPEDAESWGLERAKEIYPESDGWSEHLAHLNEMSLEVAASLLKMLDLDEFNVEYDDPARAQIPTFTVTRERLM
jgi:hypothetical protein